RVKPHFAHVAKTQCDYTEPETLEHIMGKKLLKTWIEMIYPSNVTRQEYYLEEIGQRADIITIFPDGHRLCIEFQCS
ncbi:competence protein CoiA family protein, partial [Leifsonia sp. SIMBA_070]